MRQSGFVRLLRLLPWLLLAGCGTPDIDPMSRQAACANSCTDAKAACLGSNTHVDLVAMCDEHYQTCLERCPRR
jgi:hypothetical protein